MDKFFSQFQEMVASLSLVRKISMMTVLGLSVAAIIFLVHVTNKTSMEPLFTNLNAEDMGSILTQLDKQNIKYELDQSHRSILIPAVDVLDVRMKLAESGLPRHGGVGFEIFDKTSFGMSDFEQRVVFQRALEGELSRTIGGLSEVESARIHLVMPEKSLFSDTQQEATASVILNLKSQTPLSRDRVNAITHLVASAVDNLDPQSVTVVDTEGHMLSSGEGQGSTVGGGLVLDQKAQIEKSLEKRIVDLLSPVVGLGKIVARVSATVDFTSVESTDEIVDPNKSAVLSESRTTSKKTDSSSSVGGAAGATANLPGGGAGGGGSGSGSSDENSEQIAYSVSKTVRRQITPMGAIKNLSVAILVDGVYNEKDGKKEYAARAPEELQKLEELVKKAIGFSADRADQIKVENMQFQAFEANLPAGSDDLIKSKNMFGFILNIAGNAIVVLIMAIVFFFVVRPMIKSWSVAGGGQGQLTGGAETEIRNNMAQLIRQDPMAAANAIRQFLK